MSLSKQLTLFCGVLLGLTEILPVLAQEPLIGHPAATRVGPDQLYPQPLTADWECPSGNKVTCTYSQSHRSVSKKTHTKVYDNYSVPEKQRNAKSGEVDHYDPLCNGGSNDIKNLWYQPAKNMWNGNNFGYHQKDDLENWVCIQMKAGKLDPKEAFEKLTSDWVKFYMEVNPKHVKFK